MYLNQELQKMIGDAKKKQTLAASMLTHLQRASGV
jgi:hypothetical protein